jgi:hypothetical protein
MTKNVNSYNCGGYALETFDWFCPYKRTTKMKFYNNGFDYYQPRLVKFMLKMFPTMRIAKDINDLKENERMVAFRTGYRDFHFVKVTASGRFYHKAGDSTIARMSKREFFSDQWYNGYDSEIVFLAIAK